MNHGWEKALDMYKHTLLTNWLMCAAMTFEQYIIHMGTKTKEGLYSFHIVHK